jgi:general secretion pathway protein A
MSYHEILGLDREPFSNSPDPDFFHSSPRHAECLRRLEIAVRLKRGLCVVMGEVGTGKTTVCRRLIRTLGYDPGVSVHLLLDPCFEDPRDFLAAVAVSFGISVDGEDSGARIREAIQEFLLAEAGKCGKIVVLCVDEGQKITGPCLEILRELLNFETNTHKMLQIVVFAQNEFAGTLRTRKNLADRVNTRVTLKPLSFAETKRLIRTRLRLAAGDHWKDRDPAVFTRAALYAIHRACGGYPRKIMRLCHATLLEAVGREKTRAGLAEVRAARRAGGIGGMSWRAAAMAALPVAAVLAMLVGPGRERAAEMLDTGLVRMGEVVSKASDAVPQMPGIDDLRRVIASFDNPSPAPEAIPEAAPAAPQTTADAAVARPVLPEAPVAAASIAEPVAESAVAPVAEPATAQAATPEASPMPAPAAQPQAPAAITASQAVAAAAAPAPAQPLVVAGDGMPALPTGFTPQVQRVVPDSLSASASGALVMNRNVQLAAEAEQVVIDVSAAQTAARPVAQAAAQPVAQPVAQAVAQPVAQAVAQPAAQPVVQPLAQPIAQPAALTVSLPTIQATAQPVAQTAVQPAAQPVVAAPALATPVAPAAGVAPQIAAQPVSSAPPLILGEVVVRQGWSLSKAAARLYGSGGKRVMSAVAAANPGITDMDMVRPGHRVAFPARETEPLPKGARVVLLGRQTGLDEAFAALASLRDSVPQAVLYAHFSPREGLVFDVVLDRYHTDQAAAEKALSTLPLAIATRARVVEYVGDAMVAYSSLEPAAAPGGAAVQTVAQNAVSVP